MGVINLGMSLMGVDQNMQKVVRETGIFLIEIMPVMFIPAAVGLMESWSVIRPSLLPYIIVIIVSTIIVMAVSGLVTQKIINNSKKSIKKGDSNS